MYPSVLMTNKTPCGMEKHHESTEPEVSKTAIYARKGSIIHWAVHDPIAFS